MSRTSMERFFAVRDGNSGVHLEADQTHAISLPIYVASLHQERIKARFPWSLGRGPSKGALPVLCFESGTRL